MEVVPLQLFLLELAQWQSTRPLIQRFPVRFRAQSHTGVMDYDEACFMHLTPGVVHNFPKAVGVSRLNNRWWYTTPGLCGPTAMQNMK